MHPFEERCWRRNAADNTDGGPRAPAESLWERMASIRIRRSTPTDLREVLDLIRACIQHMELQGIYQWDEVYPSPSVLEDDVRSHSLYAGLRDERLCGILALNEHQDPEYSAIDWVHTGGKVIVVHRLAVHPGFQRQGVGTRLMDFAEEYAAAQGYTSIRLDAFTLNPAAVALYERRGYRNAGVVTFRKGRFYCFEKALSGR